MNNQIDLIKEWVKANGYIYVNIDNDCSIDKIYNLLINNIFIEPNNGVECLYYGSYYKIQNDNGRMIKYYLMGVDYGNSDAMYALGHYYYFARNFDKMKEYFLMSIEKGCSKSMHSMGVYYYDQVRSYANYGQSLISWFDNQKNIQNMEKYFLMAIAEGCQESMTYLGRYYQQADKFDSMLKYYLMAIEKGDSLAMNYLGDYYRGKKDFDNCSKYYQMAFEAGDLSRIHFFASEYKNNKMYDELLIIYLKFKVYSDIMNIIGHVSMSDKIIDSISNLEESDIINLPPIIQSWWKIYFVKIKPIQLHFDYTINGLCYNDAKKDFNKYLECNKSE